MFLTHRIHCKFSGIQIGILEYETCAGHMPYLSHWNELVAIHPVFSLPLAKLLAYARGEYDRIAKAAEASTKEEELLQVTFLAMLHALDSIHQEVPALPPLHIVQSQMPRLFALLYWKFYLESKRFAFPEFKINILNNNNRFDNIHYYIDACFDKKAEYEKGVKEAVEKEKIEAAERALKSLRNSWVVPNNRKHLWRWVRAHLPEKYQPDAEGWMSTIFLGNDDTVMDFEMSEVDLMQNIIEGECPAGTPILAPIRKRLDDVRNIIYDNKHAFTFDFEQIEDKTTDEDPEPQRSQFPNEVAFIKAKAGWFLRESKRKQSKDMSGEM